MKNFFNFLDEPKGNKRSSLRVNLFLLLLVTMFVIIYQVIHEAVELTLIGMLLTTVFGAKLGNDHLTNMETKIKNGNNEQGTGVAS